MTSPSQQEIDELVVRWAQTGARGPELVEQVTNGLRCSAGIVRRFVQNHYPGLMTKPRKERTVSEHGLKRTDAGTFKVPARRNDVYRLPSRKRQGGHTF